MDDRLIETNQNNTDHDRFLFCAQILDPEKPSRHKYYTHLFILSGHCIATNGATIRKAMLKHDYEEGLYRVFRKKKDAVVIYRTDDEEEAEYPTTHSIFGEYQTDPICQINVTDAPWLAHAAIIQAIEAAETFNVNLLKGAAGVYDLYLKDRQIILDNTEYALAMAPVATQMSLPGV